MNTPDIIIESGRAGERETEEILRNLSLLYGSVAGEQALDRDFGLDAALIDRPHPAALSLLTAEIARKTARYEPRAQIRRVLWQESALEAGEMKLKVVIALV